MASSNLEMRALLGMVLARLESDPTSAGEWEAINDALREAKAYAHRRYLRAPPRDALTIDPASASFGDAAERAMEGAADPHGLDGRQDSEGRPVRLAESE